MFRAGDYVTAGQWEGNVERHSWVVSDPPHSDIDYGLAGTLLGLTNAEVRIKVNFKAPEVWMAFEDSGDASRAVEELAEAGLKALVVPAQHLLRIPPPAPASSFSFADDHLVATVGDRELRIRYSDRVIGSFCSPPPDFSNLERRSGSSIASARHAVGQRSTSAFAERIAGTMRQRRQAGPGDVLERRSTLDLYWSSDGLLQRVSIAEGVVDFAGLGDDMRPRARDNMQRCVDECRRVLTDFRLDTRFTNVRPRRRLTVRDPITWQEGRKLYSFGSVGLQGLLENVSPDLAPITQFELGSRLSYLVLSRDPTSAWVE